MEDLYLAEQKRVRRHEAKRQHHGDPAPTCLNCGCRDIEVLISVPVYDLPKGFLEEHHLAGRVASTFTVTLCRNCHAILTDWQTDWNKHLRDPKKPIDRLAALLQGIAHWLRALGAKMIELAVLLEAWVKWLIAGMQGQGPA